MFLRNSALILALLLVVSANVEASILSVNPTSGVLGTSRWESNVNSAFNAAEVKSLTGYTGTLSLMFKQNFDGNNTAPHDRSGSLANNYVTTFTPLAKPIDFLIKWLGSYYVNTNQKTFLLVKDGKAQPANYVFDISSDSATASLRWDGMMDIEGTGFFQTHAISHVAIFGGSFNNFITVVPEPGSFLVWAAGMGCFGLIGSRRRRA